MSDSQPASANRAVFLSYASQDAEAAKRICEALRSGGIEVWFDAEGGLEHGDEWDAKIRRQIKECVLFIPVISAATQARHEGYFRIEWELAAERAMGFASGVPFILPVVIDEIRERDALVPDRFRKVQWTRLPGGAVPPEVRGRLLKLWSHRAGLASPEEKHAAVTTGDASLSSAPDSTPARGRPYALVVAAALAVAALAGWWLAHDRAPKRASIASAPNAPAEAHPTAPSASEPNEKTPPATPKAVDDKSIAVLPFANLSDDKANEYFSDGISEELLTVLQKIPGLPVAARTSAFSFKGKNVTVQEIGRTLNIAHLVEGSVQKSGNRVKISARLSRAATGEQLWSENFTRDLVDVFAVEREIAQTIIAQLRGQLTGEEAVAVKAEIQAQVQAAEKGGTKNIEAHELYLQGKFFVNQSTAESAIRAAGLLRGAVELDPQFALAWAELARAGWVRGGLGETKQDFEEGFKLAREAVDRAMTLAPDLAAVQMARVSLLTGYDFDWQGAAESLQRAVTLAPSDPAVLAQATQLAFACGQADRAVELSRQAVALDPVNPFLRMEKGFVLASLGRYDEAKAEF